MTCHDHRLVMIVEIQRLVCQTYVFVHFVLAGGSTDRRKTKQRIRRLSTRGCYSLIINLLLTRCLIIVFIPGPTDVMDTLALCSPRHVS